MTDRRISPLDLTLDQVEQIELEVGKPFDQWDELPSKAVLIKRTYQLATGTDAATVGAMTLRELAGKVSLGDDEPEVAETANPTPRATSDQRPAPTG